MQPIGIIDDEDDMTEVHLIPAMSWGGANPVVIIATCMGSMDSAEVRLCVSWEWEGCSRMLTKTETRARGVSVITPENQIVYNTCKLGIYII